MISVARAHTYTRLWNFCAKSFCVCVGVQFHQGLRYDEGLCI